MTDATPAGAAPAAPVFTVFPPDAREPGPSSEATATPETTPDAGPGEPDGQDKPETDTSADDSSADDEAERKARGGVQKRISELTARQRAAERERDYWREQAMRGQAPGQAPQAPQQPQPTGQPGQPGADAPLPPDLAAWVGKEPRPEDFPGGEWDPAFNRALNRYDNRSDQARMALAQRVQQQRSQQQQQQQAFTQRVGTALREAVAADASLSDVFASDDFPMPQHVAAEVIECEAPARVLAYLGKHPAEAQRVAALRTPQAVARALGAIEAKISAPPAPPKPSAAPPPPAGVRPGRVTVAKSVYDLGEDSSLSEYRRLREGR